MAREYVTADFDMADGIYKVLHTTIETIYPKYYPKEVVEFFCGHHSREHVLEGIASGNMRALIEDNTIMGIGCFDGNHITGVYVLLPEAGLRLADYGLSGRGNCQKA